MGKRHARVFGRSEGKLEEIAQDDEVGRVGRVPEHPKAFAERGQHRGRCRGLDRGAVRRDLGQDAVQSPEVEIGKTYPSDCAHDHLRAARFWQTVAADLRLCNGGATKYGEEE